MSEGKAVLVIEDDPVLQDQIGWSLNGYDLLPAATRSQAIELAIKHEPDVALLDLGLPPDPVGVTEGFATLDALLNLNQRTKIIVLTGRDTREHARTAIAAGAHDFCGKPMNPDLIRFSIDRAMHVAGLEAEIQRLQLRPESNLMPGVIGESPVMHKLTKMINRVAPTDLSILLEGESGTGKELVARALHQFSDRADKRFVAINCAAIPENLLEAELFGFEKGAYTGAAKSTPGKVELAHGGTLFLDEVGDLPLALQGKILRYLQEKTIERIGGRLELEADARVICATHRNLAALAEAGHFRQDLYFRLAGMTLELPALRERLGDARLLAVHFLGVYSRELSKKMTGFCESALKAIDGYEWPGNVREMQNRIKRAVVLADEKFIRCEDLDLDSQPHEEIEFNLKRARQSVEHDVVRRAMIHAKGNVSKTARLLGVSRPTLYDLMRELGVRD